MANPPNDKKTRDRSIHRLTARQVETAGAGFHQDGGGLVLLVSEKLSRKWEFRYKPPAPSQKPRETMGFGSAAKGHVSLATARELAAAARDLLVRGIDPKVERDRKAADLVAVGEAAQIKTFGKFAEDWMDTNEAQLRNKKHRDQWRSTLRTHAASLWQKAPSEITTDDVLRALTPIWTTTPETARRTAGRIERILNAARAAGLRSGDNPAQWRGHLSLLLPKRPKAKNHPAVQYAHAPAVLTAVRARAGVAARALEFLVLTNVRSQNVREMTWGDLDANRQTWTIPAEKMKVLKAHRVPLTDRAREILAQMETLRDDADDRGALVFPGERKRRPMSDMTINKVLKRMQGDEQLDPLLKDVDGRYGVAHGFRSTFRDWAEDVARFPVRVIEAAMAHTIKDKAEAAYRRGDAYDARSELMAAWEAYLSPTGAANVVQLRTAS